MTREPDDERSEDEVSQAAVGEGSEATEPGEAGEGSQGAQKPGASGARQAGEASDTSEAGGPSGGDDAAEGTDQVRDVAGSPGGGQTSDAEGTGSGRDAGGADSVGGDDAEDGEPAAAGGVLGLIRARGPQKAVLVLAGLVVALIVLVGWFVVARGDEDSDETEVAADEEREGASAPEGTEPPEPTTTVPETTTTTLSPEEEAELEVIEAYEASLEAIDEASAAPNPDPEHPALEETHTGFGLDAVAVDVEVLALGGTATRYPENSEREVDVQSVEFGEEGGTPVAYLEVCEVTDREEIFVETGDVVTPSGELRTLQRAVEMHQVDGVWKVADLEPQDREEGVAGCTLDG